MLHFDVYGDMACFTRPEFQSERLTYPYITPSAARGVAESVYWHPGVHYMIEEIEILSPIKTKTIMRRERTDIINPKLGLKPPRGDMCTMRTTQFLVNPYYRIHLSFSLSKKACESDLSAGKVVKIFNRRLEKGQHWHKSYLGFRECVAEVVPVDDRVGVPESLIGTQCRGIMLYDFIYDYSTGLRRPTFYRSHMKNGIVDLRNVRIL